MDILIPNYTEIELASLSDVRVDSNGKPDATDCLSWDREHWAPLKQHANEIAAGRVVIVDPNAIGQGSAWQPYSFGGIAAARPSGAGMASGNVRQPIPGACPIPPRDGGTPNPPCEPLIHCGVTPLGFNTFGNGNFPLAGVAVATYTESVPVNITSGRSARYKASWIYVTARDQAAGFAFTGLGALTQAEVNGNSQLTGDTLVNRPLAADLFAQIGPLPLDDWREWSNTAPQTLQLTFGNPQGAAVTMQFAGAFWGEGLN